MKTNLLSAVRLSIISILFVLPFQACASGVEEGAFDITFVQEKQMMNEMMQMIANSMTYAKSIYTDAEKDSEGTEVGYFKANSAGQSNEDGVRTNADFAFICAFLYKMGEEAALPAGITRELIKEMSIKALNWGCSTHRSLMLKRCTNNRYWGSADKDADGSEGGYTWESSLWAQSLAFAGWLLQDELNDRQKEHLKTLIVAEANHQLTRTIPYGHLEDTKAEENGWDTNILACAVALYPNHQNAKAWYLKCQEFAMNTYSIASDSLNTTVVDGKRVCDWFVGQNLFDDYTLQNHGFFHTSYQNIAIQELSESYLALKAMQKGNKFALPNALKHNVQPMFNEVLKELALADGELAMPNGNDWSMYLYDQLASYSAMACLYGDADALMLENRAFKNTQARQQTTTDGSWMLNSDIGPRRMGVTGRRVAMAWLYHRYFSTEELTPTSWEEFSSAHQTTKHFPYVNVVRSQSKERAVFFSWATQKGSYTGMIGTSNPAKNKIMIPFRYRNTGNFLGYYKVNGKKDNAVPLINGIYDIRENSFVMNGKLLTNDKSLTQSFTLYATPGNAVIYMDYVESNEAVTITGERGGLMGISTDPFTQTTRTLFTANGKTTSDGNNLTTFETGWVNIDNEVGIVGKNKGKQMAFGDNDLLNSIYTSKIYPSYSNEERNYAAGEAVDTRNVVYYSNIDAKTTQRLANETQTYSTNGYTGILAPDPDGTCYFLLSRYSDADSTFTIKDVSCSLGAPVFGDTTLISKSKSSTTFRCNKNESVANTINCFIKGDGIKAIANETEGKVNLHNFSDQKQTVTLFTIIDQKSAKKKIVLQPKEKISVSCR